MNLLSIRKNNLDELVFANRNKSYGAYDLRKSYDSNLLKATLISAAVFILMFLLVQIKAWFPSAATDIKIDDPIVFEKINNLELVITLQPKPNPPTARLETRTKTEGVMVITSEPIKKEIPKDPVVEAPSAVLNHDPSGAPGQISGTETSGEHGISQPSVPVETSNAPVIFVEQMPEFPGGMEELSRFLGTNLKYPATVFRSDVEGKVFVSFVVEKDGSVTHASIEKSIGSEYDEEALRVIGLMPKWKPGKQNGKAVSVKFTLPVIFVLR